MQGLMSLPSGTEAHGNGRPSHIAVMVEEVLAALDLAAGARILDGTVAAGGHSAAIRDSLEGDCQLCGLDLDPAALDRARARVPEATLIHGSYAHFDRLLPGQRFDGILLDLGLSSIQLDDPRRGFGFRAGGPLDMRMNPDAALTAADLLRDLGEAELADIIFEYGEERRSRAVARAIVREREIAPIETAEQLAAIVRKVVGRSGKIDPATRTFQALRIATNGELDAIESSLPRLAEALAPGGALVVISFHSLEDRLVKRAFRALAQTDDFELPFRKPRTAGAPEVAVNRRARSAKLRALRRVGGQR